MKPQNLPPLLFFSLIQSEICNLQLLMLVVTDQTGRKTELVKIPQRIISLVPSQTELLADLGLTEEVVGITKFCIHPGTWFRTKTRVGGTKQIKMDIIHQLGPDLIIANKEENVKEQVEELARHYPVWISDVNTLEDAYDMIGQIGNITDKADRAKEIIRQIRQNFSQLKTQHRIAIGLTPKTAYLIWRDPYMTAGGDTFIHAMLEAAGFENVFAHKTRYPNVSIEDLQAANCQLLLLSSEPFPFKQKHIEELQPLLPQTKIVLADGEMFSWYGSRLIHAPAYFTKLKSQ
jgi:ABC-type Fe3+-hydroxamate transport system substrate-binding protein